MSTRILVVGAGATGGYYGGRMFQAGRDVTFLLRPARAAALRGGGLQIVSPHGDAVLHPPVLTAGELQAPFDLVLLTVKSYALDQAIEDFAPAVGPRTRIVPVLNGMRHIDLLARRFGAERVFGGVSQIATSVDPQGRIVQLDRLQKLAWGARGSAAAADADTLARVHAAFDGAGFEARLSPAIEREMWEKWVFLAALGGINCLLRGSIGAIEATPGGRELALQMIAECAAVAERSGQPIAREAREKTTAFLTEPGSPRVSSMYRDMARGADVEVESILGDLLDRAAGFGLATPLLAAACAGLRLYRRGLAAASAQKVPG